MNNSKSSPLVSIVVIAYNLESLISDAIESCLSQSYSNIEIIVVDDGSTDRTQDVIKRFDDVTLVRQLNSGGCSSPRNTGLQAANGEFVCFLDGDDKYHPDKIVRQVSLLSKFEQCGLVVSNYMNFGAVEESIDHFSTCRNISSLTFTDGWCVLDASKALDILIDENFTIAGTPLYRRSLLGKVGGFDENLRACEDYEHIYRCMLASPIVIDDQVAMHRRMHNANLSSNTLRMLINYVRSRKKLSALDSDLNRSKRLERKAQQYLVSLIRQAARSGSIYSIFSGIYSYWRAGSCHIETERM
ncbi:glycosyltransferase family 2 protein [Simiduia aestuariiviva]|uniref:Glycosyltransferase involved in cell wall biosynthesis n=1 Tax=Simiduia aestuariiviva TaxID=1510459 RepID=A0A839UQG0_9GAMM|nr:glycosyltransferase [Simiduia aestuariiviva]MBB3170082.1 glycosyltransferase involved in cell wall biosynthesis [Simiduia aestuariiviva]